MLQRQRFQDWHCLLIDDRSSDAGPAVVADLVRADHRFHALTLDGPKCTPGPAAARSFGMLQVGSPLVAFCDVDDLWHPEKLERQLAFHQNHQLDLSVTGYGRFRDAVEPALLCWRCPPRELNYRQLLGGNPLPMLTVLIRTELVSSGFPDCPHEDFALWLRLFRDNRHLRYGCLPEGLGFYRLHSGNHTSRRRRMLAWTDAVFREHGLGWRQRHLALSRWLSYQLQQAWGDRMLIRRPAQSLKTLLTEPPVCLEPGGSLAQ